MGSNLGTITTNAADDLGLTTGCAVGVGIIDAHAGGLGLLGAAWEGQGSPDLNVLETALAFIGGTSNCLMAVSREPRYIEGVWGPYYSAMVPGLWLTEGGQSATGALVDHLIYNHPGYSEAKKEAGSAGTSIFDFLNRRLKQMQLSRAKGNISELTE